MNKKPIILTLLLLVFVVAAFTLVTLNTPSEDNIETAKTTETIENSNSQNTSSNDSNYKLKAESLIGEVVSQDDVSKKVGQWKDFNMSSEGCERGVYAGNFYYDNFMIFSKTYDKGKTYHIESINEK